MLNPMENVPEPGTLIWSASRVIITHTLEDGRITRHPSILNYTDLLPHLFSCKGSIISVGNNYGCFKYLCGMGHRLIFSSSLFSVVNDKDQTSL